jgi:hypothetical protein
MRRRQGQCNEIDAPAFGSKKTAIAGALKIRQATLFCFALFRLKTMQKAADFPIVLMTQ